MPVTDCEEGGRKGFRWGNSGTCYPYSPNDPASRARARAKAVAQGQAIAFQRARERGRSKPTERDFK